MIDWLHAFHFLRPWWLLLALLGPLALWLDRRQARDAGGWRGVVAPHLLPALLVRSGRPARLRAATLAAVLFPLAAIALAGPSWRREASPFVTDRAVMIVALDLSHSAEPALAGGKRKIRDIVAARPGARTGLVAYAGTAHAALPPTDDARLIETYLDALGPQVMPRDGSDAAAAVTVAARMLDGEAGAGTIVFVAPGIPATVQDAFAAASGGMRHAVLVLATGAGPFPGAPGATIVSPTPDTADAQRVAALAQRHFALAPTDDPSLRWRDAGVWLVLLLVPVAALAARRGVLAALLVLALLGARPAMAAGEGDLGWFWRLWLTPDQRGQVLLDRGQPARAAGLFTDTMRRGVALYRAGDFDGAAAAFATLDTADAQYNRGNALMMRPQGWNDAIPAYDRALQLRPDFAAARDNRAIAQAFQRQQQDAERQRGANQTEDPFARPPSPDQQVSDQPPERGRPRDPQANAVGPGMSDGDIQAMWMRRVGGTPADFLHQRFTREDAR